MSSSAAIMIMAAFAGYFLGSISFARLVARRVLPGEDISTTEFSLPDRDIRVEMTGVSATSLSTRVGPRYGCLTGVLDMIKAAVPTLYFQQVYPDQPYYLVAAVAAVVGHNWPIYHRFRGGRGLSPMIGGLAVVDPLAIPVSFVLSNVLGLLVLRDVLAAYAGFAVLLIPWFWLRTHSWTLIVYAMILNLLFLSAMRPELVQYIRIKRSGVLDEVGLLAALEGTEIGRAAKYMQRYGLIKDRSEGEP